MDVLFFKDAMMEQTLYRVYPIILVLLLAKVSFGKPYSDSPKNLVLSKEPIYNETRAVLQLDKLICQRLTTPSFQDALTLLSELLNVHLVLSEVRTLFEENNEKAWGIMGNIDDCGGIRLLKMPINGTLIQKALRWPDSKMQDVKAALTGISTLWRELNQMSREPVGQANYPKDLKFQVGPPQK